MFILTPPGSPTGSKSHPTISPLPPHCLLIATGTPLGHEKNTRRAKDWSVKCFGIESGGPMHENELPVRAARHISKNTRSKSKWDFHKKRCPSAPGNRAKVAQKHKRDPTHNGSNLKISLPTRSLCFLKIDVPCAREAHFRGCSHPPGCQSLSRSNLRIGASFFPMEKTQHRPGDCSRRGFATQIEAHGLENELPVYAARRFPKSTQVGL